MHPFTCVAWDVSLLWEKQGEAIPHVKSGDTIPLHPYVTTPLLHISILNTVSSGIFDVGEKLITVQFSKLCLILIKSLKILFFK